MNYKKILKCFPFIMALLIIPMIVRLSIIKLPLEVIIHWNGNSIDYDFYSNAKSVFLIFTSFITAVLIFLNFDKKDFIKNKKYFIPFLIMVVAALLSTFLRGNTEFSLSGSPERYEGLYTYIGYFLLFVFAATFKFDEDTKKIVFFLITLFVFFNFIIGLLQYTGYNFFSSDIFKRILVPGENASLRDSIITRTYSFKNINGFNSHYNYMGTLSCMLTMFFVSFAVLCKDRKYRIISLAGLAFSLFLLIGCNARSGIVAVVFATIILFFTFMNNIFKTPKTILVTVLGIIIVVFIGFTLINNTTLLPRFNSLVIDAKNLFNPKEINLEDEIDLKDLQIDDSSYAIKYQDITFVYDQKKDAFYNEKGEKLNYKKNEHSIINFESPYDKIEVEISEGNNEIINKYVVYHKVTFPNTFVRFDVTDKGKVKLVNHLGLDKDTAFLNNKTTTTFDKIGSGRGYIISKTLPLLKKCVIIGYGPDTFLKVFPQDDVYRKIYVYGDANHIVDKPHNLYLLTAINFGIPALIAFIVMIIFLFIDYKRHFKHNPFTRDSILAVSCLAAIFAYMGSGFFNDSVITIAPIFFVFLGIAVNYITGDKVVEKQQVIINETKIAAPNKTEDNSNADLKKVEEKFEPKQEIKTKAKKRKNRKKK